VRLPLPFFFRFPLPFPCWCGLAKKRKRQQTPEDRAPPLLPPLFTTGGSVFLPGIWKFTRVGLLPLPFPFFFPHRFFSLFSKKKEEKGKGKSGVLSFSPPLHPLFFLPCNGFSNPFFFFPFSFSGGEFEMMVFRSSHSSLFVALFFPRKKARRKEKRRQIVLDRGWLLSFPPFFFSLPPFAWWRKRGK